MQNDSDECILIELSICREQLETLCASFLEEENLLTRYFKGALYGVASHPLVIFQTGGDQAVRYYLLAMLLSLIHILAIWARVRTAPGRRVPSP